VPVVRATLVGAEIVENRNEGKAIRAYFWP
jgi:hypothetical protein